MKRRDFILLVAGATVLRPFAGRAQELPVIGFLNSASSDGYAVMAEAFRVGLKEAGYVDGKNVRIEYRWADNVYERLPALAADLVERNVSLIVANSPSIAPAKAATKTIPITFMSGDDPVRLGFVNSLAKPGGNATGVTIFSGGLAAKRLGILRDLVPQAKTVGVLINSDWASAIPAGYESRATALAGGLISYGASVQDGYRQVGVYAGRVLNGENPAEMPVTQPTKFELVINQQTARTLGLAIPANVLALADEVIE